jgi:hypothetical protein
MERELRGGGVLVFNVGGGDVSGFPFFAGFTEERGDQVVRGGFVGENRCGGEAVAKEDASDGERHQRADQSKERKPERFA